MFSRITIIGLGLIGGSIARTVRARHPYTHITGFDISAKAIQKAIALGAIDQAPHTLAEAVSHTDLIIICTPLRLYPEFVPTIRTHASSTTLITDVGSAKKPMLDAFAEFADRCVPAHPIAGKAQSGMDAADEYLFDGKRIILTPIPATPVHTVQKIQTFWEELGGKVEEMPAMQHDILYAAVSHLPQALLFCEGRLIQAKGNNPALDQHLRISHSNPTIWADIFIANRHALLPLLESTVMRLPLLTTRDVEAARSIRHTLNDSLITLGTLPALSYLIATLLVELAPDLQYGGSGFRDSTACLLSYQPATSLIPANGTQTTFLLALHNLIRLIRSENIRELIGYLKK